MKAQDPNISIEVISSFMEYFSPKQLEKVSEYAAKLYKDKRYKIKTDVRNFNNPRQKQD